MFGMSGGGNAFYDEDNPREYQPFECFVRAIEINPNNANAWGQLGLELEAHRSTTEMIGPSTAHPTSVFIMEFNKGRLEFTYMDCYKKAIELEQTLSGGGLWNQSAHMRRNLLL
tara:strand:- start:1310 stop:1651 length:342 start_codon:yes stop_codon:yes gene_type:complete